MEEIKMFTTNLRSTKKLLQGGLAVALVLMLPAIAHGAGTLKPKGSAEQEIKIQDHHINVTINNGFARTEVIQTFHNPNQQDLEAIYTCPVPESASLSEYTIYAGETELHGEVVAKEEAERIYQEEKNKGNDAGLAKKESYKSYQFHVARVPANDQTRIRYVYYQPLQIDTGIGRYVYPLEEGGTDDAAESFWERNEKVESTFSADIDIRFSYPIEELRFPGFDSLANINKEAEGEYRVSINSNSTELNKDLVLYYRLAQNLPGRVDLIPYRESKDKEGTFMLVVTPGIDLKPLNHGADYVFVLDISGSMTGKYQALAKGVSKALEAFRPEDRFRIVLFNDYATSLTSGWVSATPENVNRYIGEVSAIKPHGGTNMYSGISQGLEKLDADRATSLVLVTDAVTNRGVIDPKDFHKLLKQYDVRVFGFLMGNNANWPLMKTITQVSGGFHERVSNADDIVGKIMLAKSKILHEALHDVSLSIRGVKTQQTTEELRGKVYRGQQLVIFGKYDAAGQAEVSLQAKLSGADKTYSTTFNFPEVDKNYPEVERLWALNLVEELEFKSSIGLLEESEANSAVENLGVEYQLVTDQTSMLVLDNATFQQHGIKRRNLHRVKRELQAQNLRISRPIAPTRVDQQAPMFSNNAPRLGRGGGALDPNTIIVLVLLACISAGAARRNLSKAKR
jgi:Ca-activated chloride channel family protein